MAIWFTSDTHFRHKNIIKYCNRPFETVEVHDAALIRNWNACVQKEDTVYHLGDFAFGDAAGWAEIIQQLNGNINLIRGNHDHRKKLSDLRRISCKQLNRLSDIYELKVVDEEMGCTQIVVMCHYPIESWNMRHHGAWHLHGHSHGTILSPDHQARLDVGVDACNYAPLSYDDVKAIMTRKVFKPIDHHGTHLWVGPEGARHCDKCGKSFINGLERCG
jgi:calcineurin-like phosphoesterase family protein